MTYASHNFEIKSYNYTIKSKFQDKKIYFLCQNSDL